MTEPRDAAREMARLAAELVPALTERLRRHGLGEIEVRHGELRVRVAATPSARPAADRGGVEVTVIRPDPDDGASPDGDDPGGRRPTAVGPSLLDPVTSPAVGYFVYADGLGPGLSVSAGTEIGFVEMLGIRHEVRAVADGVVRHLVAESGEPVEYGQLLVEIDRSRPG
jgi:acetyl-CoA carboxylase biotin carboxyl carrier protein